MQKTREETNPCPVVKVPDLNSIYVNGVHAALQRMSVEVDTRQ